MDTGHARRMHHHPHCSRPVQSAAGARTRRRARCLAARATRPGTAASSAWRRSSRWRPRRRLRHEGEGGGGGQQRRVRPALAWCTGHLVAPALPHAVVQSSAPHGRPRPVRARMPGSASAQGARRSSQGNCQTWRVGRAALAHPALTPGSWWGTQPAGRVGKHRGEGGGNGAAGVVQNAPSATHDTLSDGLCPPITPQHPPQSACACDEGGEGGGCVRLLY